MSILNVNQLQPVGGGNTITVSASDVNFSGNISIGSSFVGTASTATLATISQGLTGTPDITVNNIQSGVVTATTFIGDGSGITGVTASGSGINIKDSNSTVGVAATVDFGTNLNVSPASAGIVTVTVGNTDFEIADKIIHTGDTNTAIRFPADDTVSVETAGTERLRITSSGDLSISGNVSVGGTLTCDDVTNIDSVGVITARNGIHIPGGGNLVGIGTTNPLSRLHVSGTHNSHIRMTNTSDDAVDLIGDSNRTSVNSSILAIKGRWNGTDVAKIVFQAATDTTDKDDGNILFYTKDSGSSIAERLRITSTGLIGIGTDNPQEKLHIQGDVRLVDNSPRIGFHDANAANNLSCTGGIELFDKDGNRGAYMGATEGSGFLSFGISPSAGAAPTEKLRITSDGNVGVFNAVAQAYTNEGTYTTKLRVGSDTISSNQASAIQIGGRDSTGTGTIGAIEFFNHRNDDIIAKIICKRDLSSSSKLSAGKLDFYTDDGDGNLNKHLDIDANGTINAGRQLRLDSGGVMYVQNSSAATQVRIGTLDGSSFENREHAIYVYGHSASDYTLIRGCNTADGTPVFDAQVSGSRFIEIEASGDVNSQGPYTNISDQRLKENIIDSPSQWDDVKALRVRKFNFTEASGYPMNTKIGFIAQEVEETSPGLVKTRYGYDEEGQEIAGSDMKLVKTSVITTKAFKALQEAMARIEVLESRLNAAGIAT